jgi:hypothetical protein
MTAATVTETGGGSSIESCNTSPDVATRFALSQHGTRNPETVDFKAV